MSSPRHLESRATHRPHISVPHATEQVRAQLTHMLAATQTNKVKQARDQLLRSVEKVRLGDARLALAQLDGLDLDIQTILSTRVGLAVKEVIKCAALQDVHSAAKTLRKKWMSAKIALDHENAKNALSSKGNLGNLERGSAAAEAEAAKRQKTAEVAAVAKRKAAEVAARVAKERQSAAEETAAAKRRKTQEEALRLAAVARAEEEALRLAAVARAEEEALRLAAVARAKEGTRASRAAEEAAKATTEEARLSAPNPKAEAEQRATTKAETASESTPAVPQSVSESAVLLVDRMIARCIGKLRGLKRASGSTPEIPEILAELKNHVQAQQWLSINSLFVKTKQAQATQSSVRDRLQNKRQLVHGIRNIAGLKVWDSVMASLAAENAAASDEQATATEISARSRLEKTAAFRDIAAIPGAIDKAPSTKVSAQDLRLVSKGASTDAPVGHKQRDQQAEPSVHQDEYRVAEAGLVAGKQASYDSDDDLPISEMRKRSKSPSKSGNKSPSKKSRTECSTPQTSSPVEKRKKCEHCGAARCSHRCVGFSDSKQPASHHSLMVESDNQTVIRPKIEPSSKVAAVKAEHHCKVADDRSFHVNKVKSEQDSDAMLLLKAKIKELEIENDGLKHLNQGLKSENSDLKRTKKENGELRGTLRSLRAQLVGSIDGWLQSSPRASEDTVLV